MADSSVPNLASRTTASETDLLYITDSAVDYKITIANLRASLLANLPMRFRVDGQGFVLTTGVKGPVLTATFAGTITGWYIHGNASGSIVFDIWKKSFATGSIPTVTNTITASAKPTLSSAFAAMSTTLTG